MRKVLLLVVVLPAALAFALVGQGFADEIAERAAIHPPADVAAEALGRESAEPEVEPVVPELGDDPLVPPVEGVDAEPAVELEPPTATQEETLDFRFGGPPLTEREAMILLQTTTDRTRTPVLQEPGFNILLRHAFTWEEPITAGVMVPDFAVIREHPESMRGRLFTLRGFLIRSDPVEIVPIRGPHTESLTEWVIKLDRDPTKPDSIIVFLSNPPEGVEFGDEVVLTARFFKLWRNVDTRRGDQVTDFPVFIGRSAARASDAAGPRATPPATGGGFTGSSIYTMVVSIIIIVAVFLYFSRRLMNISLQPKPLRPARRPFADDDVPEEEEGSSDDPFLPESPADAMAELARRRAEEKS